MKKLLLVLSVFVFGIFNVVNAQREPQQTHFMLNKLSYNPAFAGTQGDKICVSALYHNQWMNFKSTQDASKAPTTLFFNGHMPLQIGNNEIGLGLTVLNDQLGFEKITNIGLVGNYHKDLKFATLSGGLNLNFGQAAINGDWKSRQSNDPLIPGASVSKSTFSLGLGTYLYTPVWNVGLSLNNLNQPKLWNTESKTPAILNLHGGYIYRVKNSKIDVIPGMLYKTDFSKSQLDLSLLAQYNEMLFGGLSYHSGDAIALILGVNYKNYTISTSYDITTSDAAPFGGKIEVFVKYCFNLSLPPKNIIFYKGTREL